MMAGWTQTTLGGLEMESNGTIQTGPFGSQLHASDYSDDGTPVIMPMNIRGLRIDPTGIARISDDHMDRLARHKLRVGDIVYSRRGDVEKCALITEKENGWLCGTGCLLVRVQGPNLNARFLSYALSLPDTRSWITQRAVGATMPNLNTGILREVPIAVPAIESQQAIAATLGALDDKIESNQRTIKALIALAHALYEDALAAGAYRATIGDIAEFHNRRRIPLSSREREARKGNIPYYGATGVFGYVEDYLFDEVLVLVGEDGSVVREDGGPVIQYIWGKSWINNHAHPLTGRGISNELLYLALDRSNIQPLVTGAVQPKVSMGNLRSLTVELPDGLKRTQLEDRLASLFGLWRTRADELQRLGALRDVLLPELLSGRIRIPELQEAVAS